MGRLWQRVAKARTDGGSTVTAEVKELKGGFHAWLARAWFAGVPGAEAAWVDAFKAQDEERKTNDPAHPRGSVSESRSDLVYLEPALCQRTHFL